MLNRRIKLFAIALVALALPVVANAQTARVEGMSLQGDYIKDYTSIYTYPSTVSHVGNLIYADLGDGNNDRALGAVLGNLWEGKTGTWAIHLHEFTPNLGQGDQNAHPGIGVGGQDLNFNANHSFDLMWGKRFGGTSLGFRLNRSFFENEVSTATTQTTVNLADTNIFQRNIVGYGGGVGFEVNPSTMFEAGILYQSRTFERTTAPIGTATNSSEDSPGSYELTARLMWQWQPNVMVVPVFKWYSFDYSYKTTTGPLTSTRDASQKGWQIGAAGNWTLNQNDLFVLGLTAAHNTFEQDTDVFSSIMGGGYKKLEESIYPQVFAALETHTNSWLTLRFGAAQSVSATLKGDPRTVSPGTPTTKRSFSDFNLNIGAGVKVGGLQFDAVMENNFYNDIGFFMTGNWTSLPKVTATYAF